MLYHTTSHYTKHTLLILYATFFQDMPKCDLLIIMGTSLTVQPFASLVNRVTQTTPRLLINRDKCGQGGVRFDYGKGFPLRYLK